jgi:hypothetical protein
MLWAGIYLIEPIEGEDMKNLVKLTSLTMLNLLMPRELIIGDPLAQGQFLDIPLLVGVLETPINN